MPGTVRVMIWKTGRISKKSCMLPWEGTVRRLSVRIGKKGKAPHVQKDERHDRALGRWFRVNETIRKGWGRLDINTIEVEKSRCKEWHWIKPWTSGKYRGIERVEVEARARYRRDRNDCVFCALEGQGRCRDCHPPWIDYERVSEQERWRCRMHSIAVIIMSRAEKDKERKWTY